MATKCYRCNAPAEVHSWKVCALPGVHWICTPCDIALNALVMAFMGVPDSAKRVRAYAKRMR